MSNDTLKVDRVAFRIYTKLCHAVNDARTTVVPRVEPKADRWFNLVTPEDGLLTKEATEPYLSLSSYNPPNVPPSLEIQVLLVIPQLASHQVLVHLNNHPSYHVKSPIEPTPHYILLESHVMTFTRPESTPSSPAPSVTSMYKYSITFFRSLYSLLRILPAWKLHNRLKRRTARNGNMDIVVRLKELSDDILEFGMPLSSRPPSTPSTILPTETHTLTFPLADGAITLTITHLINPSFQIDEKENLLSTMFLAGVSEQSDDIAISLSPEKAFRASSTPFIHRALQHLRNLSGSVSTDAVGNNDVADHLKHPVNAEAGEDVTASNTFTPVSMYTSIQRMSSLKDSQELSPAPPVSLRGNASKSDPSTFMHLAIQHLREFPGPATKSSDYSGSYDGTGLIARSQLRKNSLHAGPVQAVEGISSVSMDIPAMLLHEKTSISSSTTFDPRADHHSRNEAGTLNTRNDEPTEVTARNCTIYSLFEEVLNLFRSAAVLTGPTDNQAFQQSLSVCSRMSAQLDPLLAILSCRDLLLRIDKLAMDANVESTALQKALRNDGARIADILHDLLNKDHLYKEVLQLQGDDARRFLDSVQTILDRMPLTDSSDSVPFDVKARRLIVRLSKKSGILPSCLFIQDVSCVQAEAIFGGSFGDIYRARYHDMDVALKRIRIFQRDAGRHEIHEKLCREAIVWRSLDHPNVLPFLGIDADTFPSFFCLVSPWMAHGTINKYLKDFGHSRLNMQLQEIAQGLEYLHSQGIAHGDLRGNNVLIDSEHHPRLADFGLTVFADATAATRSATQGGSVRWMAPELLLPEEFGFDSFRRTPASDMYSYACVIFELYTGGMPWPGVFNDAAVSIKVVRGFRPERPTGPCDIPDTLWSVVERCWKQDAVQRWTATDAIRSIEQHIPLI